MSKEIFLYSKDKKYKCAFELADSLDNFKCPDHSVMVLFEERENGTYIIAQAKDKILETEKDQRIAELEEQLKNAIVPKFKIGQEIYYYHIARNKTYSGYVEDIQWFATRNGIYYRISQLQRDYFWIREDEIFATKEEAQAKLKELQGEKDVKD